MGEHVVVPLHRGMAAEALLDEGRRFPLCQPDLLSDLFQSAGLSSVATTSLRIETAFHDFDEFWSPFRAGTGPAPSYVASLEPAAQKHLAIRIKQRLQAIDNRPICLSARAFAVRGTIPS